MAYITTEEVKEIRTQLNEKFNKKNGWKLSVKRERSSCISVDILEAPLELRNNTERVAEQVNTSWISSRDNKESIEPLELINKIVNKKNHNNSDPMTDYFDVGFYFHLSIGNWDKGFKIN